MTDRDGMTSRKLATLLKAEVGTVRAVRILRAVRFRLADLPKGKHLSEEEFMAIVDEETMKIMGGGAS